MFRELGWVVALTTTVWAMVTLDRGYVAFGGEIMIPVYYYYLKWGFKTLLEVVKELGDEKVE